MILALAAALAVLSAHQGRADSGPLPADAVRERWLRRLDGRHFSATIALSLDRDGKTEKRRLVAWRDDLGSRRERVMVRFEEPADMRGLGLLYLQNPDRGTDYFLYQPATKRVRRIAESLAREDVYGIDLEFLGFGLAQVEPTRAESVSSEVRSGRSVLRLEETALSPNPRFDRRVTWLDPETFVPLETIRYRGNQEVLRARTETVRSIQGVPTPTRITFDRVTAHEMVTMEVIQIDYEAPIPEAYFSTMALIKQR